MPYEQYRQKRNQEKAKYFELQQWRSSYGASNHGKAATPHVARNKPTLVVDFGCGCNNFINNLNKLGIEGKGVDFVYEEADIVAPMHNVPLPNGCADFITAFDSLEHLLPEDVDLVFEEMQRIAMPDCAFCFSISYTPSMITVHGQNLHPTVRPAKWWAAKIRKFATVSRIKHADGKYRQCLPYLVGNFNSV